MKTDVAIVIVSYNSAGHLGACLESVFSQRQQVRQQVIVVDNDSSDDTVALVRSRFPGVELVLPGTNLGFAGGVNLGASKAKSDFLLLLKPRVMSLVIFTALTGLVCAGAPMNPVLAATAVLSLYTAAFYAEIFRAGIVSIEVGQWDAAKALGLSRWQVMRRVVLPQAVRRMVPPFMNQSITQLKNTSLVSTIAVPDLLYQGSLITADTYRPLEVYTVVALIYFALLFPATVLAQWYERRMANVK